MTRHSPLQRATESGSVSALAALGLTILALLALIAVDLGAVMVARRTATAAADAAALAAAGARLPTARGLPARVAAEVAAANGATLTHCRCRRTPMAVTVVVPVHARLLGQLGVTQVTATARADLLVPP